MNKVDKGLREHEISVVLPAEAAETVFSWEQIRTSVLIDAGISGKRVKEGLVCDRPQAGGSGCDTGDA